MNLPAGTGARVLMINRSIATIAIRDIAAIKRKTASKLSCWAMMRILFCGMKKFFATVLPALKGFML